MKTHHETDHVTKMDHASKTDQATKKDHVTKTQHVKDTQTITKNKEEKDGVSTTVIGNQNESIKDHIHQDKTKESQRYRRNRRPGRPRPLSL